MKTTSAPTYDELDAMPMRGVLGLGVSLVAVLVLIAMILKIRGDAYGKLHAVARACPAAATVPWPSTASLSSSEAAVLRGEEWCQNFYGWFAAKRRNLYVNVGSLASWLERDIHVSIQVGTDPKGMPIWATFTRRASTPGSALEVSRGVGG